MNGAYAYREDPRGSEPVLSLGGGIEGFYTYKINGVDVVVCPFDKAHVMLAKRIQYHLRKCIKQHRGEKVVCPYNATEFVDAEDFEKHLTICKSRNRVIVNQWNSAQNKQKNPHAIPSPPVDRTVPYDIEEYW